MTRPSMVEVVFTGSQFEWLHAHLFQEGGDEQAAYAFASPAEGDGKLKLLVHHLIPMERDDYITQNGGYLHLKEESAQRIARYTLDNRYSLIEIHSHPFAHERVGFSSIDTTEAAPRFAWFAKKVASPFHHLMLVFGHDSADGMIYDPNTAEMHSIDRVSILSQPIKRYDIKKPAATSQDTDRYRARYHRQVQAFGERGQVQVKATRVGIVGLGGIGSVIAQQLALLGVRQFVLVDGDVLEESNLNRFVGGDWHDAVRKRKKADVIRDFLETIDPNQINITVHDAHFPTPASADSIKTCDVLFGCTDNHGSRLLLNSFAVQYMLPYIDIGVGINTDDGGKLIESGGQYRVVVPDGYCLECIRAINPALAADDLLSEDQRRLRQAHGYIPNEDIRAPSVAFLNSTLASMAVGEFLNLLTGYRKPQHLTYYFLHDHSTRTIDAPRREDCAVCGHSGHLAMGDLETAIGLNTAAPLDLSTLPVPSRGRPNTA